MNRIGKVARSPALPAAVLAALIRDVVAGEPLDQDSRRHLDLALPATPILMAGRATRSG